MVDSDNNINNNLDEFEEYVDGLISIIKKREVEMFDLKNKYHCEIERAKLCEMAKLEIE